LACENIFSIDDGQTETKRKYIVGEVGGLSVILLEIDPDNNNEIVKSYVYAQDDLIAQYDGDQATGDKYFYVCDRLGNVRQVIDVNASVQYLYTYGPFGKDLESDEDADPPGNSFRFTGQFYDADLDQYFLRARQYSPDLARFTARDPYPGQFNEPATLHAYLYCLDDPINRTDLTGEFTMIEIMATTAKGSLMALKTYSTCQSIKSYVQQFKEGVELSNIFKNIAIDAGINYAGGKLFKVALKGLGSIAKAAHKGGKNVANLATQQHHVWPKFLGGLKNGNTIIIPKELHGKFHDTLYKRLQKHFGKSCRSWSTKTWENFLKEDPGRTRIMWQELIDTTTELDSELGGVDVMNALLNQMAEQL